MPGRGFGLPAASAFAASARARTFAGDRQTSGSGL